MVRRSKMEGKTLFLCEECGLGYADRETAQKCEDWCKKTDSCSLEITKKALYLPEPQEEKWQVLKFFKPRKLPSN